MINQEKKELVLTHYGGSKLVCVKCGFADVRALSIDHINGGGRRHREGSLRSSGSFYSWLMKNNFPEGYQTLCMNCQFIKRWENKENFWKPKEQKLSLWDKKVEIDGTHIRWKYYQLLKVIQGLPLEFDIDTVFKNFPCKRRLSSKDKKALRGYIRTALHRLVKKRILIRVSFGVYKKALPPIRVSDYMRK
jgi:hypothetical protein